MSAYKHILFATDLIESHHFLVDKVKQLVKQFAAKLTLVHCIEPIPAYGYPGADEYGSPFIDRAEQAMAKLGQELQVGKADQRVEFGSVKAQVINVAKELKVDLIVVGSHGQHGLSILLGSSASAIVHGSPCDVLAVRYPENN